MERYSVVIENWNVSQKNGTYNCEDVDSREEFFSTKEKAYENLTNAEIEGLFFDEDTPTWFEVAILFDNEIIDNNIICKTPISTKHLLTDDEMKLINY